MTEERTESASRHRVALFTLVGLVAIVGVAIAVSYFNRAPQMGPDEDVFRTVDALYTAVRMNDAARVADCEKRLGDYRHAGKLPKGAADALARVIAKTRDGRWDSAAESLYEFMLAQRREGDPARPNPEHEHAPKSKALKARP